MAGGSRRGMGHVQKFVLRDLVVEGEWRYKDALPGTPRAAAVLRTLESRGFAHMVSGDMISSDAVYRPTERADQWFLHEGCHLWPPGGTPFVYLHTQGTILPDMD